MNNRTRALISGFFLLLTIVILWIAQRAGAV